MHFDYLEEHEMLRDAARGFFERHDPIALLRGMPTLDRGARRANLRAEAAQGWTGMMIGEQHGGAGLSIVEAMVAAEELGRAAHVGAFASLIASGVAIMGSGSPEQQTRFLPGLASGEIYVTRGGSAGKITAHAEAGAGGWLINGTARLFPDADIADYLVVDALTPAGPSQFTIPAATASIRDVVAIDVSRRFCDLSFDNVAVPASALLGVVGQAAEPIAAQLRVAAVLTAADSVGIAARLLDMTVAYTKERIAFGKPIAAFQAVKHRCADMLISLENARVATWYAAVAMRDARPDLIEAASIAKFHATEGAALIAGSALQLHGGIGMTWEHDLHFFYKRAKANELLWGSNASHREIVARELDV